MTSAVDKTLRPYQCALCSAKFKLLSKLELHMSEGCPDPRATKKPRPQRPRLGPRAMQACLSCATSKTKCDNDRQCKRCRKRGVRCVRQIDAEQQERAMRSSSIGSRDDQARDSIMLSPVQHEFTPTEEGANEHHRGQANPAVMHQSAGDVETEQDIHLPDLVHSSQLPRGSDEIQPEAHCVGWDLNLLSEHFNLSPPHTMVQELDFLFPLPQILPEAVGQSPVTPMSISPVVSQDKSELIRDAFKMATGRWTPVARNFEEDEEKNLSAPQGRIITTETLDSCDIDLLPDGFPLVVRDRLLTMLVSASDSRDNLRISSAFPSCDILGLLVKSFLAWHTRQDDTWIHIPTFDINKARIELVAAILAAGALRSHSRPVQKFGSAIHELLAVQLWKISRISNILTRDLQFLQAYALQIHIGLWSGDKRKVEMAAGAVGNIVNMLRGGGRFRKSSYVSTWPPLNEPDHVLQTTWESWAQDESFKRLAFHLLFHCGEEALITSISGPLHYIELTLSFPKARMLWFARSAPSWRDSFQSRFNGEMSHVSPIDCLANMSCLQSLPAIYDANIARLSVLHAVSSMMRICQQSRISLHPKDGLPSRESLLVEDSQHRWLLRALETMQQQLKLCPSGLQPPPVTVLLLLEFLHLHSCASIDQMELLAGKEGFEEAQAAYLVLQRWVDSADARRVLWHCGQVIRLVRALPHEVMADFHCVAIYHVSLCLWVYVTISIRTGHNNDGLESRDAGPSGDDDVLLDGDETLKTHRWTTMGHGRPILSNHKEGEMVGRGIPICPQSAAALMQMCIQTLRHKYPSRAVLPPATESFCNLMRALGGITNDENLI